MKLISHSAQETISFGNEFAKTLRGSDVIGLYGNLGSGKTHFVKGICNYFNVKDPVTSPTFILVNEYRGEKFKINHFDLYRLKSIEEFLELGAESYEDENSILIIEWPEISEEYFKGNIRKVNFEHSDEENVRVISYK